MRKYSSNLAFVDLLFNLLVGFTSLFIIAFLMINPIAKDGEVTPPRLSGMQTSTRTSTCLFVALITVQCSSVVRTTATSHWSEMTSAG